MVSLSLTRAFALRRTIATCSAWQSRLAMSACSSQLSASLLGSDVNEDADSAALIRSTDSKPRRSASAGRNAAHKQVSHNSSCRKQTVQRSPCSRHPPQPPVQSTADTPCSPACSAGEPPGACAAESVASQGHTRARTPESSASTGKSQAVKGRSLSHKPSRQRATANSRHSQHSHSITALQGPKPNFLDRLQDHASSKAPAVAFKKQQPQQQDAKAAEMKAKLLEWRQQQQQQKLQKQQPVTKQPHVSIAANVKRKQQQQPQRTSAQPQDVARASSADAG